MIDQRALFVGQADRIFREDLVALEQAAIEADFGVELGDFGECRVVCVAQRRTADHRVQMRHSAPRPTQPLRGVLQWLHHGRPRN